MEGNNPNDARRQRQPGLSYKFQRLREQLRQAVASGELQGKLPGERTLARRFNVNAKTLSKALTDLAAEGLLERSVGRGTFVRGSAPRTVDQRPWLLISDSNPLRPGSPEQDTSSLVSLLREANPGLETIADIRSARPSFLNQFSAVIDCSGSTPDNTLRDLVVRNIPVVLAGKEPQSLSTHAVLLDRSLALARLGRALLLAGHRRLAVVDGAPPMIQPSAPPTPPPGSFQTDIEQLGALARRLAPDSQVDSATLESLPRLIDLGATALLCTSVPIARQCLQRLQQLNLAIPAQVSIVATDAIHDEPPCSGFYVHIAEKAEAILHLLRQGALHRPVILWLAGQFIDRGTCTPINGVS